MTTEMLVKLSETLNKYPPYMVKFQDTIIIDEKGMMNDINLLFDKELKEYLLNLYELVKNRDYYLKDNKKNIKDWLVKIYKLLDSLENILIRCEDMNSIFDSEKSWAYSLSIESMIELLETSKMEIQMIKGNVGDRKEFYKKVRVMTINILASRLSSLMMILETLLMVLNDLRPPSDVVGVIGKGLSEINIKG